MIKRSVWIPINIFMPQNELNASSNTSHSLPFWAAYLSDSIFSSGRNPYNPMHLLNTLKGEAL